MSVVGYTVFGRPVQHEYVSNGLFNELNLNNESYLSDRIDLKQGLHLATINRYMDNNGVEVIVVLVNSFAISYNDRAGGFVGAGIAFIGKPQPKLIYHRLKQLHKKSLSLLDQNNKFKTPKIDNYKIKLPDLKEEGLFMNRTPRNYSANDVNIGVLIEGNFYESLMGAIQGFTFNEIYFGAKTAYVSNSLDLLKNLVSEKYTYNLYNLVDYSNTLNKFKSYLAKEREKLKEDRDRSKEQINALKENSEAEINKREQELNEFKNELDKREDNINYLESNKQNLEKQKTSLKNDVNDLKGKIDGLNSELTSKEVEKEQLEKKIKDIKNDKFKELINRTEFKEQKANYDKNVEENFKREQEKNAKTDWFKVVLVSCSIVFFLSSLLLGFILIKKNKKLTDSENRVQSLESNIGSKEDESNVLSIEIPKEYSANSFFDLTEMEKTQHKNELDDLISLFNSDKYKSLFINNNFFSNRKWNFREILNENEPSNIDKGLERLVSIKKIIGDKEKSFFHSPRFLISDIKANDNSIKVDTLDVNNKGANAILNSYLGKPNNIYNEFDIEYNEKSNKADPILLMHFRWMVFNYKKQKKDIHKLKRGDKINVPIVK